MTLKETTPDHIGARQPVQHVTNCAWQKSLPESRQSTIGSAVQESLLDIVRVAVPQTSPSVRPFYREQDRED